MLTQSKRVLGIVALFIMFSFCLAATSQYVGAATLATSPTQDKSIWVNVEVKPDINYSAEKPKYNVVCNLIRIGEKTKLTEFDSAVVTVNSVVLTLQKGNAGSMFKGQLASLKVGDLVKIQIKHEKIVVSESLRVPASLASISSKPTAIEKWVKGDISQINLNWSGVSATEYYYYVSLFGSDKQFMGGNGYYTKDNSIDLAGKWLINEKGAKGKYVTLGVTSINSVKLPNYSDTSKLKVFAPSTPTLTSLPK